MKKQLEHPRLPLRLALLATLLVSPSLFLGFHLDDHVHRYMLSDLPGAAQLHTAYVSPFGIANGRPASIHWQIEQGYAPWWTYDHLLVSLWRPLSELTHRLDAALWPSSAIAMHAQNLAWFALLIVLVTVLYRELMGTTALAGFAALLYAVDHTHGFAVGWIANRNALVATVFGVATMIAYHRARRHGSRSAALMTPWLFVLALLSGESACAVLGYLVGYALALDRGSLGKRITAVCPLLLVFVTWRWAYGALGYGAHGSGLYLDPVQEPFTYLQAAIVRLPALLLGALALPPAETMLFVSPRWTPLLVGLSYLVLLAFGVLVAHVLSHVRSARMWALGMFTALLTACATHPNNRLLFFVNLGAMPLVAQVSAVMGSSSSSGSWKPSRWFTRGPARLFMAAIVALHVFVSPLLLPLTACSVAATSNVEHALRDVSRQLGKAPSDVIFVSAPDYFYVKLLPVLRALSGLPPIARLRALSFGPVRANMTRVNERTLSVSYDGPIIGTPLMELYRTARMPLRMGQRITLSGLTIDVESDSLAGHAGFTLATFQFAESLDSPRLSWLVWQGTHYARFVPPKVGQSVMIAPARVPFGL